MCLQNMAITPVSDDALLANASSSDTLHFEKKRDVEAASTTMIWFEVETAQSQ